MATYLINCSKSKAIPSAVRQSSLMDLSFHNELGSQRIKLLQLNPQIQLCWDRTVPAWELYRGRLFKKVTEDNWQKSDANVFILSALFGWVRHTDLLPLYDVSMNQRVHDQGQVIWKYWRASDCLLDLVPIDNIDLLSIQYRKSLSNKTSFVGTRPLQNWRDKYGSHKGEWLNQQLNLI